MRKRFLYLLALFLVGVLFTASTSVASASSAPVISSKGSPSQVGQVVRPASVSVLFTSSAPAVVSKGSPSQVPQGVHPASVTSNCDDPNTAVWNNNGLLCAVASYATPCLRIHDPNNWNVIACEPPGTIIALDCQVKIPSMTYLGNSYWDVGVLPNGKVGEFSDAYMDTEWTNNTGSPSLSICGGS